MKLTGIREPMFLAPDQWTQGEVITEYSMLQVNRETGKLPLIPEDNKAEIWIEGTGIAATQLQI